MGAPGQTDSVPQVGSLHIVGVSCWHYAGFEQT